MIRNAVRAYSYISRTLGLARCEKQTTDCSEGRVKAVLSPHSEKGLHVNDRRNNSFRDLLSRSCFVILPTVSFIGGIAGGYGFIATNFSKFFGIVSIVPISAYKLMDNSYSDAFKQKAHSITNMKGLRSFINNCRMPLQIATKAGLCTASLFLGYNSGFGLGQLLNDTSSYADNKVFSITIPLMQIVLLGCIYFLDNRLSFRKVGLTEEQMNQADSKINELSDAANIINDELKKLA